MMHPYGIAKDVLIEFQDSSTLVDFMVVDMDPHQQTSIILGKPFLRSVRATVDKTRGIINMKVFFVKNQHESWQGWEVHLPPQEPRVLLLDLSPPIHMLEKGKMCGGAATALEKSPLVAKQKVVECYDTR
jgi:hypothetical protein